MENYELFSKLLDANTIKLWKQYKACGGEFNNRIDQLKAIVKLGNIAEGLLALLEAKSKIEQGV